MSGDFMYRHREEARTRLYDPETFPIPLKCFDEMKQTKIDISGQSRSAGIRSRKVYVNQWETYKDPDVYTSRQY